MSDTTKKALGGGLTALGLCCGRITNVNCHDWWRVAIGCLPSPAALSRPRADRAAAKAGAPLTHRGAELAGSRPSIAPRVGMVPVRSPRQAPSPLHISFGPESPRGPRSKAGAAKPPVWGRVTVRKPVQPWTVRVATHQVIWRLLNSGPRTDATGCERYVRGLGYSS